MTSRRVTFAAGESVVAPLAWGQYAIWKPLQWFGDETQSFNLTRSFTLADGVTEDRFADGVRRLVEEHASLRTRFVAGEQHIAGAGELGVALHPLDGADPAERAAEIATSMAADSFDLTSEWPVRIAGIVSPEGHVVAVSLVASHVGVDSWALVSLGDDLRDLLEAPERTPAPAVRWDALRQLEFEASPAGKRVESSSLSHWAARLRLAPASMFDFPQAPSDGLPIHRYRLVSRAVAAAAPIVATRSRASVSTVLLTVAASWLAAYCGHDTAAFQLIAGNRFDPQSRALRAPTAQDGLFVLPVPDGDLSAAARTVLPIAARGYLNARYHPERLAELKAEIGAARGVRFDLSAYFNDVRRDGDWAPPLPDATPADLAALREQSTFTQFPSLPRHDMKFMVNFNYLGAEGCGILLLTDARYLPAPAGERFLRGLELILCTAVHEELTVAEAVQLVGVEPAARDADWVRTATGWVHVPAARALLADAVPDRPTAVFCRPAADPELTELVGYVAGDAPESLVDLHRRVVAALPERPGVATPDEYVVCRAPQGVAEADWAASAVLSRGSGRTG
ncbi:condensation domain-containing protein [Luedemannella helvata]|uniref:condensation domain-containing protein n=1 Tax=Luedemannella helvata TaxID=349315 RepID=UPI0031D5B5EF